MKVIVTANPVELGKNAGLEAAKRIREAIAANGYANIILATGTSQFETLKTLTAQEIDWSRVVMFHLDEYIGLPETAPASFRKYLKERFLANLPPLKAVYLVNGEADPAAECERLGEMIRRQPIDVALVGIGENGHLGFNDPPADFETNQPFIVVRLDEDCRRQQLAEGWFDTLEAVPGRAITMSIRQILASRQIICSVPDSRKAAAVRDTLQRSISNLNPASILQSHPACTCYLDKASAELLDQNALL